MFDKIKNLTSLFSKISGLVSGRPPAFVLENLLVCVESGKLSAFSAKDIFLMQSLLINDILARTHAAGGVEHNADGIITGLTAKIDDRHLNALVTLARATNFSDYFHDWVDARQKVLATRLARQHDFIAMNNVWSSLDENGRLGFLQYVTNLQHEIFSDDTMNYGRCQLDVRNLKGSMIAAFTFRDALENMQGNTTPVIIVNNTLLQKSSLPESLISIVHEGIHSITRQMGMLAYRNLIPKTHPLYADAVMMEDRMTIGAYLPGIFGSIYQQDQEERLAYRAHENFLPLFFQQVEQRSANRVTIGPRPQ